MPTYEYECPTCGVVEAFQKMRDEPLKICPNCHAKPVQRMVSRGAGVIFKGGGFYETDYGRSSDYQGKAKADAAPAAPAVPAATTPATTPAATTAAPAATKPDKPA